jgi:hypothetical protein
VFGVGWGGVGADGVVVWPNGEGGCVDTVVANQGMQKAAHHAGVAGRWAWFCV